MGWRVGCGGGEVACTDHTPLLDKPSASSRELSRHNAPHPPIHTPLPRSLHGSNLIKLGRPIIMGAGYIDWIVPDTDRVFSSTYHAVSFLSRSDLFPAVAETKRPGMTLEFIVTTSESALQNISWRAHGEKTPTLTASLP